MASRIRPETKPDGAVLELIARGEKDKYFIKDDIKSDNPFDWRYKRFPATIPEVRRTVPLNAPSFGGKVEWELDLPGDVLLEANIRIDLPSWIPPNCIEYNKRGKVLTTSGGVQYGYTSGIAYFLFKKIELLQDNILIQECSGDSLYLSERGRGSWNSGFLQDTLRGLHSGTAIEIQRNATPETLCLRIPIPGTYPAQGAKGFPICCLRKQSYRLRVHLRTLEELVEASDGSARPQPWGKQFVATASGLPSPSKLFEALPIEKIPKPVLTLETKQIYLKNEDRATLEKSVMDIPFIRFFDNPFSINSLDYASIRAVGIQTFLTRFLDANYTVEQLNIAFRSEKALLANQLWNLKNGSSSDFYSSLQLVIAGQVREGPWEPTVWKEVMSHANNERSIEPVISYMAWALGSQGQSPSAREPTGGINFTTADRPMLSFIPTDVEANSGGAKNTQILCLAESWAVYRVEGGRGYLAYAN